MRTIFDNEMRIRPGGEHRAEMGPEVLSVRCCALVVGQRAMGFACELMVGYLLELGFTNQNATEPFPLA